MLSHFGLQKTINRREHADSYYAATLNDPTRYPALTEHIHTDVCIVGGGFSGLNTAIELSQRGYKVVLLEANRIGWGASGRNGGQVLGGIGHDHLRFKKHIGTEGLEALFQMGNECVDIVRERVNTHNIDCDLQMGYLEVATKPRHMRELAAAKAELEDWNYPHEVYLLDQHQIRAHLDSERYLGGLYFPDGHGHCHPLNLALGEARAATQLGAKLYENAKVIKIIEGNNPSIYTEQGQVSAKHLVLCGNAYLNNLVPFINRRIIPVNSSVVATQPLPDTLRKTLLPSNAAVSDANAILDYYRLTKDGRLLFGGLANYTGMEPKNLPQAIGRRMLAVFPQLQSVAIDYSWSGQLGVGVNRMPQLGRLKGNVYYVQAYAGHGVAPSHMMGRIIAEMIAGQAERFDVFAKIPHMPMVGGHYLKGPLFALVMNYYRLKDAMW